MSKEQELMNFLQQNVFDPILNSPTAPPEIINGVHLTMGRMNRLTAAQMVQYYWSALATANAIAFAKKLKTHGLPCFEDVLEPFRDRFTAEWAKE